MNFQNQIETVRTYLSQLSGFLGFQTNSLNEVFQILEARGSSGDFFGDPYGQHRIFITGVGKNAALAIKASETFASLGIYSAYLNTAHLSHGDFGFIGSYDAVIHLSRSGRTEEMLAASKHLKKIRPNVKQILLTCQPLDFFKESPLHSQFDIILYTGSVVEIDLNALAPTTSTTVLLTLLDILGTEVSARKGFTREDFLAYHPGGALGEMLKKEKECLESQ